MKVTFFVIEYSKKDYELWIEWQGVIRKYYSLK